jgi:N-methylhydantoinase B
LAFIASILFRTPPERIISIAAAKIEYGVVLDPETLALNEAETEYLRRQITA